VSRIKSKMRLQEGVDWDATTMAAVIFVLTCVVLCLQYVISLLSKGNEVKAINSSMISGILQEADRQVTSKGTEEHLYIIALAFNATSSFILKMKQGGEESASAPIVTQEDIATLTHLYQIGKLSSTC
jgi:hypothetical protein